MRAKTLSFSSYYLLSRLHSFVIELPKCESSSVQIQFEPVKSKELDHCSQVLWPCHSVRSWRHGGEIMVNWRVHFDLGVEIEDAERSGSFENPSGSLSKPATRLLRRDIGNLAMANAYSGKWPRKTIKVNFSKVSHNSICKQSIQLFSERFHCL